jgi:hypothetical protein
MPDYSAQLAPADRWAVAAYIRVLQLSQNAKESDVPQGTKVQNLSDIAEQEGLPASFAGPWPLATSTNVQALPPVGTAAGAPAENPKTLTLTGQTAINPKSGEATSPKPKN